MDPSKVDMATMSMMTSEPSVCTLSKRRKPRSRPKPTKGLVTKASQVQPAAVQRNGRRGLSD